MGRVFQGRIHLARRRICRTITFTRISSAYLISTKRWRLEPILYHKVNKNQHFSRWDLYNKRDVRYNKSRLKNRDRQERNRIYVEPMYITFTALRVHLCLEEEEIKRKGKRRRKSNTDERKSGYWTVQIYKSWENETACDRRNVFIAKNVQGLISILINLHCNVS